MSNINKDKENISAILYGAGDLRLEHRPVARPGPNQALIAVHSVGICGSDVHYWSAGAIGNFVVKAPMVLGHESSGTVVEIGENVRNLSVGDRVAMEPGIPCRCCTYCKIGRYNLCGEMKFLATPPVHGDLSRYHVHDADFCFKLPDHVSMEEGALLEPLSVAVHACRRAGVTIGSSVLICGAGPIGLVTLLTSKLMGAAKVIITDISEHRLSVAKNLGASGTVLVDPKESNDTLVSRIKKSFDNDSINISIECSGVENSVQVAIYATQRGGCLLIVGLGKMNNNLPIMHAATNEIDIKGVFRYVNTYKDALSMISSGSINVKPLITHRFDLKNALEAFRVAQTGTGGAIKVVIKCDPESQEM